MFSQNDVDTGTLCIGVIPVGNGNDWIKTFGISSKIEQAIQQFSEQKTIIQDIGILKFKSVRTENLRYFINMAGFGYDAKVANTVNSLKRRGFSGAVVYAYSLLASGLIYRMRKTRLCMGSVVVREQIFSVSVGIGKYNGGGMMQVPNANPVNGSFQTTVIKKIGNFSILKNFRKLYSGKFVEDKHVQLYDSKKLTIGSSNGMSAEVDGEYVGVPNFKVEILPKALRGVCGDMV